MPEPEKESVKISERLLPEEKARSESSFVVAPQPKESFVAFKPEQSPVPLDYLAKKKQLLATQDLEIIMPAPDIFSDELRIVVTNQGGASPNQYLHSCQIKVYSSNNQEISSTSLKQ